MLVLYQKCLFEIKMDKIFPVTAPILRPLAHHCQVPTQLEVKVLEPPIACPCAQ